MTERIKEIKAAVKNNTYDWAAAIEAAADRILSNPETLLWR